MPILKPLRSNFHHLFLICVFLIRQQRFSINYHFVLSTVLIRSATAVYWTMKQMSFGRKMALGNSWAKTNQPALANVHAFTNV